MRLGIIRLSSLGDIVRLLPLLAYMQNNFPIINITLITEDRFSHLFDYFPYIHDLIIFPRRIVEGKSICGKIGCLVKFIHKLRMNKRDLVVDLHGILRSAIISRLSRAQRYAGFTKDHSREFASMFYTDYIPLPSPPISRIDRYFGLLDYLGLQKPNSISYLSPVIPYEEENHVVRFLNENNIKEDGYLFFFIGASKRQIYKRWDLQSFLDLASKVLINGGPPILLGWGPDEREIIRSIQKSLPSGAIPIPEGNLGHLLCFISKAKCLISSDTGPLHLSAIMGTKSIALFGPTDPIINKPYGDRNIIIRGGVDMASITADQVYDKIRGFCLVG